MCVLGTQTGPHAHTASTALLSVSALFDYIRPSYFCSQESYKMGIIKLFVQAKIVLLKEGLSYLLWPNYSHNLVYCSLFSSYISH